MWLQFASYVKSKSRFFEKVKFSMFVQISYPTPSMMDGWPAGYDGWMDGRPAMMDGWPPSMMDGWMETTKKRVG